MKAAVVLEIGQAPTYTDFKEPTPLDGEVHVAVTASALTNFTKVRAAGTHFSFAAQPPFVAGIDGVGRLADGRRVYFVFPRAPFGGMAQATVVPWSQCVAIPDGADDVAMAAIADPGMSAWVALEVRAKLKPGETVLVNGATGSAGMIAVQVAKHLGASRVIATGRNLLALESLPSLGADEVIVLESHGKASEGAFKKLFEQGINVVLDYLWGFSAEQILAATTSAGKKSAPIRFVQIGTSRGPNITLPGALLRSSAIELMGSGIGSVELEQIMGVLSKLMQAAAGFQMATKAVPLNCVGDVWSTESATPRIVFTVSQ